MYYAYVLMITEVDKINKMPILFEFPLYSGEDRQ